MLASVIFFVIYGNQLRYTTKVLLLIVIVIRALSCLGSAIAAHKKLNKLVHATPGDDESASLINPALDIAARAILEDMLYTFLTLLAFLFVLVVFMKRTS